MQNSRSPPRTNTCNTVMATQDMMQFEDTRSQALFRTCSATHRTPCVRCDISANRTRYAVPKVPHLISLLYFSSAGNARIERRRLRENPLGRAKAQPKTRYLPHLFLVILPHFLIVNTASLAMNIYECGERDDHGYEGGELSLRFWIWVY
jgi:hypothetical protein